MDQPGSQSLERAQGSSQPETKEELIERLLARAAVDHKCCGSHCSSVLCDGGGVKDGD
jgi:hypothetical protein